MSSYLVRLNSTTQTWPSAHPQSPLLLRPSEDLPGIGPGGGRPTEIKKQATQVRTTGKGVISVTVPKPKTTLLSNLHIFEQTDQQKNRCC